MDKGDTLAERCRSSADRIAALREELTAEMGRRDAYVIEMRDRGDHWNKIAEHARLSVTQCVTIVTGQPASIQLAPARP